MGTLLSLPVLPFCVLYLVQLPSQQTHKCIHCPQIDYPGNKFPPHKFHLAPTAESLPSSNLELSSSSSMTKLQSSCRSLFSSSSEAKSQSGSWHNKRSDISSNPHFPRLDNWQSDGLRSDSWHNEPRDNSSNPHSPGLDHWRSNRSVQGLKESESGVSSSSTVYCLEADGQTGGSQGSGSSGTIQQG
jgi:hypothetical protein